MNRIKTVSLILMLIFSHQVMAQDAKEIVRKADERSQGEKSSYTEMVMTVVRPSYDRKISFKSWTKGKDKSLTLITSPARDKGQTFLKRGNEMWNWNPVISRMIKLPASMMSQGWMGSDFTNDDIMNESSIVVDYSHKVVGEEIIEGFECYKIELIPNAEAEVVWGKIHMWISKNDFLMLKNQYFDEDGYLIRTENGYDVREMDGRLLPSRFELIPEEEDGQKTIVEIITIKFNDEYDDRFFSQQNMKRIK
ncbi:MAG: outer membrane lipoprotein-sorting protein [Marinilabiliales bacterium]|nr:MAG: outer membrane lipoprotein-sorting protein [Marinilabiliales bacterium]